MRDLLVGHVLDQLRGFGIAAEEFLAHVGATARLERLVIAVDAFVHQLNEAPGCIFREQGIPVAAPDAFNNVPAGAAEQAFQFLNDLAVAANRTVESLQIAVDDEDQVVELFAHCDADRAGRFGLVHLAVAQVGPHLPGSRRDQPAVLEVAHEARLVNRVNGRNSHGYRGKLPEILHQPRVGIRGKSRPFTQFVAEVMELLLGQAAFKECAGIDAGRCMALKIDQVAGLVAVTAVEEMIEAHFEQGGQRGIGRDVAADAVIVLVLVGHHRHGVPAGQAFDAPLEGAIAGVGNLAIRGNGVDVVGGGADGNFHAVIAGAFHQLIEKEVDPVGSRFFSNLVESLEPFRSFSRVEIGRAFGELLVHGG